LVIKALDPDWIRIRIGIRPKMLDPDPDEINADPQPWILALKILTEAACDSDCNSKLEAACVFCQINSFAFSLLSMKGRH
jgi:hypothetical protein